GVASHTPSSGTGARNGESGAGSLGLQVLVHKLGHLEHVDGGLAAEDRLQRGVRLDHPLVLLILQLVLLDVRPELLRHFGPRDRLAAAALRQRRARRHRLHECRIRLSCGLLRRLLGHLYSFYEGARENARSVAQFPSFSWEKATFFIGEMPSPPPRSGDPRRGERV